MGQPLETPSWQSCARNAAFRTCVRTIVFLDEDDEELVAEDHPVLEGGHAYSRLVEVVCGLHSPMVGETQVHGQFKSFLDGLASPAHQWVGRLGQQILRDARLIRETHLRGLGSRTYGSAVRRHARDSRRIAIIGAGVLAQEIVDYVADSHTVDIWTRSRILTAHSSPASDDLTVLVIAAPVDSSAIVAVAAAYPRIARIIDLRADAESKPLPAGASALTLQEVFAKARSAESESSEVAAARLAAAECGRRFETREDVRPFGWEDLCA